MTILRLRPPCPRLPPSSTSVPQRSINSLAAGLRRTGGLNDGDLSISPSAALSSLLAISGYVLVTSLYMHRCIYLLPNLRRESGSMLQRASSIEACSGTGPKSAAVVHLRVSGRYRCESSSLRLSSLGPPLPWCSMVGEWLAEQHRPSSSTKRPAETDERRKAQPRREGRGRTHTVAVYSHRRQAHRCRLAATRCALPRGPRLRWGDFISHATTLPQGWRAEAGGSEADESDVQS
jgi:hypothetical protein